MYYMVLLLHGPSGEVIIQVSKDQTLSKSRADYSHSLALYYHPGCDANPSSIRFPRLQHQLSQ